MRLGGGMYMLGAGTCQHNMTKAAGGYVQKLFAAQKIMFWFQKINIKQYEITKA